MNKAKVLEATAPPSVTVTPVPADQPTPDPKPLGTPTADLIKALSVLPRGVDSYKQFRKDLDAWFGDDEASEDQDD